MYQNSKHVFVTGAASGIGRACAHFFMRAGARVSLLDRDEAGLRTTAQMRGSEQEALLWPIDVADKKAVDEAVKTTQNSFGPIDVLINCAAILENWALPVDVTDEVWDEVISINLKGVVYTCRSVIPTMQAGGAIINTSSICGTARACIMRTPYDTAKAGIVAFTRDLAAAYGPQGIRANVIVPGFIDTPMSQRLVKGHEAGARAEEKRIPLRRLGNAEEVARAVVFLASDEASYITGSVLFIDGGLSLV